MKIEFIRSIYPWQKWNKFIKPRRLTLKQNPPIYRWLCFIITFKEKDNKENLYRRNKKQTTFCYCPECNAELISTGHLLADLDWVYFKCNNCSKVSVWDFDAPCPILKDSLNRVDIEAYERNCRGIWKEVNK